MSLNTSKVAQKGFHTQPLPASLTTSITTTIHLAHITPAAITAHCFPHNSCCFQASATPFHPRLFSKLPLPLASSPYHVGIPQNSARAIGSKTPLRSARPLPQAQLRVPPSHWRGHQIECHTEVICLRGLACKPLEGKNAAWFIFVDPATRVAWGTSQPPSTSAELKSSWRAQENQIPPFPKDTLTPPSCTRAIAPRVHELFQGPRKRVRAEKKPYCSRIWKFF